ncbi:MAG: LysM peptidoglycan-binding protein [Arthrobacter sp.]|nr:LysM peptidoglycan-binding protein [Arthrobacter sp.]MCU1547527.1 LysM peptidoglycan-binding protein [Arthrobacter sp.]
MDTTQRRQAAPRCHVGADAAMATVILLLGTFLAATGDNLLQRWRSASGRQQSLSFEDQLGIAANTVGLTVVTWWAMSLAMAVAAALLERRGSSLAAAAAGRFSPAFMRRLALAALGLQLVTAPLASAATPPAVPGAGGSSQAAVSAAWTPTAEASLPGSRNPPGAGPAASLPAPPPPPAPVGDRGAGLDPRWKPSGPVVEPGPLAARQLRTQEPAAERGELIVRAGDSLWSLSAAELGPFASDVDIAREWPRLYRANRAVIGENPDILFPGQVLRLPPGP